MNPEGKGMNHFLSVVLILFISSPEFSLDRIKEELEVWKTDRLGGEQILGQDVGYIYLMKEGWENTMEGT